MEKGDKSLLEMMSLTEEINSINTKVMQIVEDLHNRDVSDTLKKLTNDLSTKVSALSSGVNSYQPKQIDVGSNEVKASHESVSNDEEPMRITPTPDDIGGEYMPEPIVRVKPEPPVPVSVKAVQPKKKKTTKVTPPKKNSKKILPKSKSKVTNKKPKPPVKPKKKEGGMFGAFTKFQGKKNG